MAVAISTACAFYMQFGVPIMLCFQYAPRLQAVRMTFRQGQEITCITIIIINNSEALDKTIKAIRL